MNIREAVRPNLVFLDLEAETADQAIARMALDLAREIGLDEQRVEAALIERERLGSTAVGNGFAIPHCKLDGLDEIVVALAAFPDGIPFSDTDDSSPVNFFFVVLSPPDQPAIHLQVLSQIARLLKRGELRERLAGVGSPDEIISIIHGAADREGL
jgi:mannitol/fructose-specific phosphotransferase system IIA component (Ntr-type)